MNLAKPFLLRSLFVFMFILAGNSLGYSASSLTATSSINEPGITESVDFDSGRWQIIDEKARIEDHLGRKSLFLASGLAYLKDASFENGVIEVDVAAVNRPSFIGMIFRSENPDEYELLYFRPHKSGQPDAVQYTPTFNGSPAWQLYTGEGFNTAVDILADQWLHVRIEISGLSSKIYFNNSDKPILVIDDLKRGYRRGSVGLWGGANGGYFSNFTYKVDAPSANPQRKQPVIAPGILSKWELSEAFDVAQRNPDVLPSPSEIKAMKWQAVEAEAPGMVVINRYRRSPVIVPDFSTSANRTGNRLGRKVVFARTTVTSDRDQIKKLAIGYSDEVTVFLNGKPVFHGNSAFRFRDPGFLGIMDVENDAVYLNLKKGRNEIVLAVSEYFGGWGFICRIDDAPGHKPVE